MAVAWGSDHERHWERRETAVCHGLLAASLPKAKQSTDSGSEETQELETQRCARPQERVRQLCLGLGSR